MNPEVLSELKTSQIWKIQDRVKNLTYQENDEIIIFYAPTTKSCFKDKYGNNPRKLGAKGRVISDDIDHLVAEFTSKFINIPHNKRVTIPKKYVMDIKTWRDIQLEYILKKDPL